MKNDDYRLTIIDYTGMMKLQPT
ncbi:hypothetical protein EXIGUO8H_20183 [Exiguobacterium sp. 8H]|nr:hypothetical protein EXIGUO8H_20183 [Exiguobacterium sp. 8H]